MRSRLQHRLPLVQFTAFCAVIACSPDQATENASVVGIERQYGPAVTLGEGKVRAYVAFDTKEGQRPLELGVAIEARAMEGALPASDMLMIPMTLPARAPVPFRFALFDWNPLGHVPQGVFDLPHFDVHFYTVPQREVDAITPDSPDFVAKANNLPTGDFVPASYVVGKPPAATPASVAFPGMGVHWQDLLSPEYQRILGRPEAYQPFTKTYVYVTWNGRITALEPMITREYLMRRTTETVQVRQPARYPEPGWYPAGYRIEYDGRAAEYRIALVDFAWRD
jgi:hypothetical protein